MGFLSKVKKQFKRTARDAKKVVANVPDAATKITGLDEVKRFYEKNEKGLQGTFGTAARGAAAYYSGGLSEIAGVGQGITGSFGNRGLGKLGNIGGILGGSRGETILGGGILGGSRGETDLGGGFLDDILGGFLAPKKSVVPEKPYYDNTSGQAESIYTTTENNLILPLIIGGVLFFIIIIIKKR